MKRTLFFMLLSAWLSAPAAWAYDYDFKADGIWYNITSSDDKTVEVTTGNYSGDVTIPATVSYNGTVYSVTAIDERAFSWCTGLTSVTIPNSVTSIGIGAFEYCDLTSVTIPESVTTIDNYAFYRCTGLTSVTIGKSVQTIGDDAFYLCHKLTSVTIPNSVTAIGNEAFSLCRGLTEFKGKFASDYGRCLIVNDTLIAFAPSGLTQYTIPDEVKVIGVNAFSQYDLTSVTIGDGVTAIGDRAFAYCDGLTSVTIPESVTTIGEKAFYDCTGLAEVTIGDGVTAIGNYAFDGCTGLTSVTIPESVTAIGNYAFDDCSGLTSVTIGNSVTTIGSSAFAYCENLTSVTIPESVQTIGNYAFAYSGLTTVTAYNPTPVDIVIIDERERSYFAFNGVDCANCKLYVPKGSEEAYRNYEGWSEFGEILPIDESSAITEIRQDNADGHITVYNLQGVPVLETDDAADLKTLQNGAYIVNGKKMIIAR